MAALLDPGPYLSRLDALFGTLHVLEVNLSIPPDRKHFAACLNRIDLHERRDEFVRELANSITAFVYSPKKQQDLVDAFCREGRDPSAAWNHLRARAQSKFRTSDLRGQFSEVLLSTVLQRYFRAAPLMRKMSITTNPEIERHGADAIHIGIWNDTYRLYIGEAKTYSREKDCLKSAVGDAIESVVAHILSHNRELDLYTYEDFLPSDLEAVATAYQRGELPNVEVHPVCLVTYENRSAEAGSCRQELLDGLTDQILKECFSFRTSSIFQKIPHALLPRMTYFILSVRNLDGLISMFQRELGRGA